MINSSTIKHVVIPNKDKHLLQIEDLSTELFSVIESMKECRVPLVLDVEDFEDIDVIKEPSKDEDKTEKIDLEPEVKIRSESLVINPCWVQGKKSSKVRFLPM